MSSSMIIVATLAVVAALATPALASVKVRCSGGPMPQTCSGDHPVCCFASDASWAGCCAIGTKCDLKIQKCVIVNPPANMSMYTLSTATDDVHITRQSLLCVGVSFVMILVSVFGLVVCGIRVKERMRMYFIRRHLRQRRREDRGSSDVDSNGESVSDATVASAQDEQTWRRMRQRLQAEAQRLIEEENAALQRTSAAAQATQPPAAAVPRSATVATPGDGFTAVLVSAAPSSTTKAPAAAAYLATTSTTSTTNKKATPHASSSVNRTTSVATDRSVSLKNIDAGEESNEDSTSSSAASSELASPVGSIQHAAVAVVRSTDPSDDEASNDNDDSDIRREVKSNASSTAENPAADNGANGADDDDDEEDAAFSPRSADNGNVNDDDDEAASEDNEPVAASAVVVEEPAQEAVSAAPEQPAVREALRVMMCRVCGAAPVDSILLPCSHAVVCLPCARGLKRCVDCKQLIKKRRKLYLASAD